MKPIISTLALAALLAAPLAAQAQASAEGTLSNFSYTLTDLLPNDGIAPSLSYVRKQYPVSDVFVVGDIIQESPRYARERNDDRTSKPFSRDMDASLTALDSSATARVSGGAFEQLRIEAAASTTAASGASREVWGWTNTLLDGFVLSPGTKVSFFADLAASVSTGQPRSGVLQEQAELNASMTFSNGQVGWNPNGIHKLKLTAPAWNSDPNLPFSQSASERLELVFWNNGTTAVDLKVLVKLTANVNGFDTSPSITPVPEPATTGMLLAGLAVLAAPRAASAASQAPPGAWRRPAVFRVTPQFAEFLTNLSDSLPLWPSRTR